MALLLPVTCWGQESLSPERLLIPGAVRRDWNLHLPKHVSTKAPGCSQHCPAAEQLSPLNGGGELGPKGLPPCLGLPVTGQSQGEDIS